MNKLNLKVTETQAEVIERALEFYMRWCIGQMHYLPGVLEARHYQNKADEDGKTLRAGQQLIKQALFPEHPFNGSYGVGWDERPEQQEAQIAYEIETVIKNHFGRSRYDKPLHYSNEELPEIINE